MLELVASIPHATLPCCYRLSTKKHVCKQLSKLQARGPFGASASNAVVLPGKVPGKVAASLR
jgi:hypothetical protein